MTISLIIIPGVIGAIFCALEHPYCANLIWVFSNMIMAVRSYMIGDLTNATSYTIFQLFAVWGVYRHLKKQAKNKISASTENLE